MRIEEKQPSRGYVSNLTTINVKSSCSFYPIEHLIRVSTNASGFGDSNTIHVAAHCVAAEHFLQNASMCVEVTVQPEVIITVPDCVTFIFKRTAMLVFCYSIYLISFFSTILKHSR